MMNGEQVANFYLSLLVSFGQVMVSVRPLKRFAILGGSLELMAQDVVAVESSSQARRL